MTGEKFPRFRRSSFVARRYRSIRIHTQAFDRRVENAFFSHQFLLNAAICDRLARIRPLACLEASGAKDNNHGHGWKSIFCNRLSKSVMKTF